MPGLMRVAAAVAALALLALAIPQAHAAAPQAQVLGRIEMPIQVQDLRLDLPGAGQAPTDAATSCTGAPAHYRAYPAERRFSFVEGPQEAGCAGVRHTLLAGATSFNVTFAANRSVDQDGAALGQPAMRQSLQLLRGGQAIESRPIFNDGDTSRPRLQFAPFEFRGIPASDDLELEWRFEDMGRDGQPAGAVRFESFAASVWDPVVTYDALELGPAAIHQDGRALRDGAFETTYAASASVPPRFLAHAAAGQFTLRVILSGDSTLRLAQVTDAEGVPVDVQASSVDAGPRKTVVVNIPPEVLKARGIGPYAVHVQVQEAADRPAALQWLSYTMLGLPAVALGVAWLGLRRTELEEEP